MCFSSLGYNLREPREKRGTAKVGSAEKGKLIITKKFLLQFLKKRSWTLGDHLQRKGKYH